MIHKQPKRSSPSRTRLQENILDCSVALNVQWHKKFVGLRGAQELALAFLTKQAERMHSDYNPPHEEEIMPLVRTVLSLTRKAEREERRCRTTNRSYDGLSADDIVKHVDHINPRIRYFIDDVISHRDEIKQRGISSPHTKRKIVMIDSLLAASNHPMAFMAMAELYTASLDGRAATHLDLPVLGGRILDFLHQLGDAGVLYFDPYKIKFSVSESIPESSNSLIKYSRDPGVPNTDLKNKYPYHLYDASRALEKVNDVLRNGVLTNDEWEQFCKDPDSWRSLSQKIRETALFWSTLSSSLPGLNSKDWGQVGYYMIHTPSTTTIAPVWRTRQPITSLPL